MKLPSVLLSALVLAAVAAAGGCGKPSDLVPTVDETRGLVETAQRRLTDLGRRTEDLARRQLVLKPDGMTAQPALALLGDARMRIQALAAATDAAKGKIAAAEQTGKSDDLARYLNGLRVQLADGQLVINANLDAVEAYLVRAEYRPRLPAAAPQPADKDEKAPDPGSTGGSAPAPTPTPTP